MDLRTISPKSTEEDSTFDSGLRPRGFDEYVGQDKVKANLSVAITAARKRCEVLDHLLFHGPPGLGKTSFILASAFFALALPSVVRSKKAVWSHA